MKPLHILSADETAGVVAAQLERLGVFDAVTFGAVEPDGAKYIVEPRAAPGSTQADRLTPDAIVRAVRNARDAGTRFLLLPEFNLRVKSSDRSVKADNQPQAAKIQQTFSPAKAASITASPASTTPAQASTTAKAATSPVRRIEFKLSPEGLPMRPRVTVATVCRTGGRYTPDVVRWFRRQLAENLRTPHRFVCLTDKPAETPGGVAFRHDWPRWWGKVELFRPGLFEDGETVVYFDLDTVFVAPFETPEAPPAGDLAMVRFGTSWWTAYGSGAMCWRAPLTAPYEFFAERAADAMRWFPSDQEVIMPAVFAAGGSVHQFPDAEVQARNGEDAVPIAKPRGPIWCAAGSGRKPWEVGRPWIPPLASPEALPDVALVACWYGDRNDARRAAAEEGLRRLARLKPAPAVGYLLTTDAFVDVPAWMRQNVVTAGPENAGLWQKEKMWNLAARRVLAEVRGIRKLVFLDVDTFPARGQEDWLVLASDALDRAPVVHPWTTVDEDNGSGQWSSFSAQAAGGLKDVCCGQGFCVAMTRAWFDAVGGWPELAVQGSGDVVAVLRWDATGSARDIYAKIPSMRVLVDGYAGPKTRYGYCAGDMVHAYHGDRTGPKQTRNYLTRHIIWDLAGGKPDAIVGVGPNGLLAWKDSALARATRDAITTYHSTREEAVAVFRKACARHGLREDGTPAPAPPAEQTPERQTTAGAPVPPPAVEPQPQPSRKWRSAVKALCRIVAPVIVLAVVAIFLAGCAVGLAGGRACVPLPGSYPVIVDGSTAINANNGKTPPAAGAIGAPASTLAEDGKAVAGNAHQIIQTGGNVSTAKETDVAAATKQSQAAKAGSVGGDMSPEAAPTDTTAVSLPISFAPGGIAKSGASAPAASPGTNTGGDAAPAEKAKEAALLYRPANIEPLGGNRVKVTDFDGRTAEGILTGSFQTDAGTDYYLFTPDGGATVRLRLSAEQAAKIAGK